MAGKITWKDLAGTAKKWLDAKTTETVTGDRLKRQDAERRQNNLEHQMEEQAGGIALTTLFPSLGRAMDRQEENRRRAEQERTDQARAQRIASVLPGSSIQMTGLVDARIDDLAITLTPDDESRALVVLAESVDPVPVGRATFLAAGFAIAGFHGDGTYQLADPGDVLDPGVHHVAFEDGEWFYWAEEYGPASATVAGGVIEATLPMQSAGSGEILVTFRIPFA